MRWRDRLAGVVFVINLLLLAERLYILLSGGHQGTHFLLRTVILTMTATAMGCYLLFLYLQRPRRG
jgi:hypothetical protein